MIRSYLKPESEKDCRGRSQNQGTQVCWNDGWAVRKQGHSLRRLLWLNEKWGPIKARRALKGIDSQRSGQSPSTLLDRPTHVSILPPWRNQASPRYKLPTCSTRKMSYNQNLILDPTGSRETAVLLLPHSCQFCVF